MNSQFVRVVTKVASSIALVGGLLVLLMSFLTSADIIGRFLGKAIPGTYELVQYIMVYVIFLSIAYLESKNGNVRVEMLTIHFPDRARTALNIFSGLCGFLIFATMLYTSSIFTWESWLGKETMYGIKVVPLWFWKFAIPFGCFFMCLQFIVTILKAVSQLVTKEG